jgi:pyruvate kinase
MIKNGIHCEVKGGGLLGSKKAIKLPSGKQEGLPVLNHLDENDLIHYALKNSKLFHL